MNIPIYVVNLKRSPERKTQMQQKLSKLTGGGGGGIIS